MYIVMFYKYYVVSLIHVVRVLTLTYTPKKLIIGSWYCPYIFSYVQEHQLALKYMRCFNML